MINIDLTKDFSNFPFGMYVTDGKNSGERFRKDFLLKNLLETDEKIKIHLNCEYGLGSSFLIGAFSSIIGEKNPLSKKFFGGISRYFDFKYIQSRVTFTTDLENNELIDEVADICQYMKEYEEKQNRGLAEKMLSNFNLKNEILDFKNNIQENIKLLSTFNIDRDLILSINTTFDDILENSTYSNVHSTTINLVREIEFRVHFIYSLNDPLYILYHNYMENLQKIRNSYICFQH
jgi:hypothetical protein